MSIDTHLAWLLDGDPAVRWQTRRDLLDEPPEAYEPDRARVATEGWPPGCWNTLRGLRVLRWWEG